MTELPGRVVIVGVTGSGKTTLARRMARLLDAPAHSMDELYWRPGWVKVPVDERTAAYRTIAAETRWVVDGLPSAAREVFLPRADLVVALDYPRRISLGRLLWRTGRRLITREPICNGNVERIRDVLGRESIIAWHFRTYAELGREIDDLAAQRGAGAPPVLRLRSPGATEAWVESLVPRSPGGRLSS